MRGVPPGKRSARRERKEGGTMTNMLENAQVSRRTFMKGSALAGLGAAAMGTGAVSLFGCSPSADGAKGNDAATQAVEETTTWGHCAINCPGRCSLKLSLIHI